MDCTYKKKTGKALKTQSHFMSAVYMQLFQRINFLNYFIKKIIFTVVIFGFLIKLPAKPG